MFDRSNLDFAVLAGGFPLSLNFSLARLKVLSHCRQRRLQRLLHIVYAFGETLVLGDSGLLVVGIFALEVIFLQERRDANGNEVPLLPGDLLERPLGFRVLLLGVGHHLGTAPVTFLPDGFEFGQRRLDRTKFDIQGVELLRPAAHAQFAGHTQ
ncbi:hypothetical protein D3C87_1713050 [compost metagenome]